MGKEGGDGGADTRTGYSPAMCLQAKERAEVMAVNSVIRRALESAEEWEQLSPGSQINQIIIINSASGGWLSKAFNDTV